jgi:hypothetical protein
MDSAMADSEHVLDCARDNCDALRAGAERDNKNEIPRWRAEV